MLLCGRFRLSPHVDNTFLANCHQVTTLQNQEYEVVIDIFQVEVINLC